MIPAIHSACNFTLHAAPGDEGRVGSLPVMIHPTGCASFWLPTTQELYALNRGEALCLSMAIDIRATPFPPIAVGLFGDMFETPELPTVLPVEGELCVVDFDDNSTGDHDRVQILARCKQGHWHSEETGKPLIQFQGDAIHEWWPLRRGEGHKPVF